MAGWRHYIVSLLGLIALKFLISLPLMGSFADLIEKYLEGLADLDFKFRRRYFDWCSIPSIAAALSADRGREAFLWGKVPSARLNFLDRTVCYLDNFQRPLRPLVVNFISSLDEPFWTNLKNFNDIARRMTWMVDILTIVVGCGVINSRTQWFNLMEIKTMDCMRHCFCMHDRQTIAAFLVEAGIVGDLVYDASTNEGLRKFAPTPERFFVIYRDRIVYDSRRGGEHGGCQVNDLRYFLWTLYRKVKRDRQRYDPMVQSGPGISSADPRSPLNVQSPRKEASIGDIKDREELFADTMSTKSDVNCTNLTMRSILKPSHHSDSSLEENRSFTELEVPDCIPKVMGTEISSDTQNSE